MSVPDNTWLHFLVNNQNKSFYIDSSGNVQLSSLPVPLNQLAGGWKDFKISFGTNYNYWSLNRTFSVPLFFIGDAADIVRYYHYLGKGYEEEIYIIILKKNLETGIYELEYKGRLELSKAVDEPRKGITVPTIEGGVLSYLASNDAVDQEVPLNPTNKKVIQILFDGTNLFDRFRYSIAEFSYDYGTDLTDSGDRIFILPFPFISNEGDSVGVLFGTQDYMRIDDAAGLSGPLMGGVDAFAASSANYSFASIRAIAALRIAGAIGFFIGSGFAMTVEFYAITSLGNHYLLHQTIRGASGVQTNYSVAVDTTISIAANEKVFVVMRTTVNNVNHNLVGCNLSDVFFSFNSKVPISTAFASKPLDMWKELVSKMTDGKFTGDSAFLAAHDNIVVTSTDALRQTLIPTAKYTVKDFFNDYDCVYDMGLKAVNNVLYIEPKANLYNDDSEIFDLGEISNLKILEADDLLCNTAKFGYKSQDYRQRNGKFEFNTTTSFKLPVNTIKKEYMKICKARGDCFGIEFLRSLIADKPTTDVVGDNQCFLVNVTPKIQTTTNRIVTFEAVSYSMTIPSGTYFVAGDQITIQGVYGGLNDGKTFDVVAIGLTQIQFDPGGAAVVDEVDVLINIVFVISNLYTVKRESYSAITGVLDNTVYNIEEMTPHRLLKAHGASLRSRMVQLGTDKIIWKTSDKNADLSTTLAGVTIAEKQDEIISTLGDILFYPKYLQFTTPVPLTFAKVMAGIGTGYIKATFYGKEIYVLPIGTMDAKPGVNQAQTWKLLAAPKNSLSVLKDLSLEGLFVSDSMGNSIFISDLNPLHFNKYNYSLDVKYQHKEMYDEHFHKRQDSFASQAVYTQKWQKTDSIAIQVITKGIPTPNYHVYNEDGIEVGIGTAMTPQVSPPGIQLPYILNNASIDLSGFDEGIYFIVLEADGTNLAITEYQEVRENHVKTIVFDYSHTTNRYQFFFTNLSPMIRVEGLLLPWYADASFETYMDELADVELLDGIPVGKRILRLGLGGLPDYMGLKLNKMLLLNRTQIEGVRYSRTADGKFNKKEFSGHYMHDYLVEISRSVNKHGLSVDETGTEQGLVIAYTLDGQAFGLSTPGAVLNIELPDSP